MYVFKYAFKSLFNSTIVTRKEKLDISETNYTAFSLKLSPFIGFHGPTTCLDLYRI